MSNPNLDQDIKFVVNSFHFCMMKASRKLEYLPVNNLQAKKQNISQPSPVHLSLRYKEKQTKQKKKALLISECPIHSEDTQKNAGEICIALDIKRF